ncbi:hypothetical protein ACFVXE_32495 [Streptomyces sp. NPDC058231]|uniref:hypothetical protein n=1 Tax=unclassified Streptomyces TaxID=2593676 RepID=UPI0036E4A5C8
MHPDTHLTLHHLRSAELRGNPDEFRPSPSLRTPRAPRGNLRMRLGWTLVELGLYVIPDRTSLSAPATPRTA